MSEQPRDFNEFFSEKFVTNKMSHMSNVALYRPLNSTR